MASALRSVGPCALLHSVPELDESDTEISSPTFNGEEGTEEGSDEEDQSEEDDEPPPVLFQSKYIDMFPLYQDYLPSLKAALQRASKGAVNELVTCQFLPGLQSPSSSHSPATEFCSPTTVFSSLAPFADPPVCEYIYIGKTGGPRKGLFSSPTTEFSSPTSTTEFSSRRAFYKALSSPTTEFSSPTTEFSSPSTPAPSPQAVRVTPASCTLWQDLPEVKESGLLNTLTSRELRLQEARFELIGSEASYLRSLGIAVNHFFASKKLRKSLSRREQHILFSNLRHVMEASESFFMELEAVLGANVVISHIEDIVLKHCSTFQACYVPYVTNMQYQEALVGRLLEENRRFLRALKKLEGDPVCQRRGLKSFLILPFQRITRLKLIMQNILKLTKPDCGAISSLKQSIEAIHQIVDKCNKGVQKMQEIEKLVQLERRLDFGTVKKVPLIVSGRVLVHEGALRQLVLDEKPSSRMSFTDVYLHLFNDLLVISTERDQRFLVEDHAVFPTHVHVKQLKPNALGLPSDSFLLHLSQNCTGQPTVLVFAPHTGSDKEVWMKVLM